MTILLLAHLFSSGHKFKLRGSGLLNDTLWLGLAIICHEISTGTGGTFHY
jgi:hypothetical protein